MDKIKKVSLDYCLQEFYNSVIAENYNRCFEIADYIFTSEEETYIKDIKYYLYLLSIITEVPDKYLELVRNISKVDIKISSEGDRYFDIFDRNGVRFYSLNSNFYRAVGALDYIIDIHNPTIENLIEKTLLLKANHNDRIMHAKTLILIKDKSYKEAYKFLGEINKKRRISTSDIYILELLETFIAIKETGIIPTKNSEEVENYMAAIDNNNFELALKLYEEYNAKKHKDNNRNTTYILLRDICKLIDSLKKEESSNITYDNVFKSLLEKDKEKAFSLLKDYMNSIGKKEFEFLISDLIELSILEQDSSFVRPMQILALLNNPNYKINFKVFIKQLFESLSENKLDEAKIYFDIISNANKLSQDYISNEELFRISNIIDKKLNDKAKEDTYNKKLVSKINNKLQQKQGIYLLEPTLTDSQINALILVAKNYPNIAPLVIGKDNQKQLVFMYSNPSNKYNYRVTRTGLIEEAYGYYKERKYTKCIRTYLKAIQYPNPNYIDFARLGLAYIKAGKLQTGIDYLIVSTKISPPGKFGDFTELLEKLSETKKTKEYIDKKMGTTSLEDSKPKAVVAEEEYTQDPQSDKKYMFERLETITNYAQERDLDIENACQELGISEEITDRIKLTYARIFNALGYKKEAYSFIKSVEERKNKAYKVKTMLEEVKSIKHIDPLSKTLTGKNLTLRLKPGHPRKTN